MKVKLKTSLAGDGFSHQYGAEVEMSDEQAARFIERGLAEPVADKAAAEPAAESAPAKKSRKRG